MNVDSPSSRQKLIHADLSGAIIGAFFEVYFKNQPIGFHRADMLVEKRVIVELKATEQLAEVTTRQLRNYLTALHLDLGLLLHFGPTARFFPVVSGRRRDGSTNNPLESRESESSSP